MGQLSFTNARNNVRAFVMVMVFALVSSFIVVMPTGTANAQTSFVPEDFASKYGTNLTITRDGVDITDSADDDQPFVHGNEFTAKFVWAVGDNPRPRPGDQMVINLPSWLRGATDKPNVEAGEYTTCNVKAAEALIVCTFTDAVDGNKNNNIHGEAIVQLKAVASERTEPVVWGPKTYDVYYLLTGERNGRIDKPELRGDSAITGDIRKGGYFSKDVVFPDQDGTSYQQIFWSVLIPAEKVNEIAQNGVIEIEDHLSDVTLTDSDTKKEITVGHYFAAAGVGGNLEISRREGATVADGSWEVQESPKCRIGGELELKNIPCATRIAQANDETGEVRTRNGEPEEITVDGYFGKNNWKKNSDLKIKIANVKPNAAYRITYYTWIPSASIGVDKGYAANPKAKNSLTVKGQASRIVKDVALYARFWGTSSGDPNRATIVIKKDIEAPSGEKPDVTEFPLNITIGGKAETCQVSVENPCKFMADPGEEVVIVEPNVTGSTFKWNPGKFSIPGSTELKAQANGITVAGNKATIKTPVRGEVLVLGLTNSFQPSVKYGEFVVKKVQKDLEPKDSTGADLTAKEYFLKFTCDQDSKPVNGASAYKANTDYDITVTAKAEKVVGEFPAGTNCMVKDEDLSKAKIKGPHANQTKQFEASATYSGAVIKAGEKNVATVTNKYQNTFFLSKVVEGVPQELYQDKDFTFEYTCGTETGRVKLKANGKATMIPQFFDAGTRCTYKEVDLPEIPGYKLINAEMPYATGFSIVNAPKYHEKRVVNKYEKEIILGQFKLEKAVVGVDAAAIGNPEFKASASWTVNGKAEKRDVAVRAGQVVEDFPTLPVGTVVTLSETKPADSAAVAWATPVFSGDGVVDNGNGTANLTIKAGIVGGQVVTLTNNATQLGQFKLEKAVVGVDAAAIGNPEFKASASWTVNGKAEKRDVAVRAGQVVEDFPTLPVGTVVTLSETKPADSAAVAWATPVFSGDGVVDNGNGTANLTIKAGIVGGQVVTLTNNATPLGRFKLQKIVNGLGAYFVGDPEFKASASWTVNGTPEKRDVAVRAGQVVEDFPTLPVGTVVTLSEIKPADGASATWNTPVFSGVGVVDKGDGTAELTIGAATADGQIVTLTNTANPQWWWLLIGVVPLLGGGLASLVPGPVAPLGQEPQAPATSTPAKPLGEAPQKGIAKDAPAAKGVQKDSQAKSLAKTGASVLGLVAIAALLAALGAFLVRRGRKS
ncbi:MAG: DUF5979 domain-containing protein [Corynebacterium sp.]|uniref:DUF5979 domain-containing protein n=1 Tax=Corynebacterium sp. TaxID=1720 RepID=UPI0026DBA7AB|nr:DUF5979 domain-containing protein [Corynebacterium sp.]MDO5098734.1 DUF5979 domain-containing protein [Corynebacterium sp.]